MICKAIQRRFIDLSRTASHCALVLTSVAALCLNPMPTHAQGASEGGGMVGEASQKYVAGLKQMTMFLTSTATFYLEQIGRLFDAEHALDTQQTYQRLVAEAHKDYHPSQTMCQYGTFARSLAASEHQGRQDQGYLNQILNNEVGSVLGTLSGSGEQNDLDVRIAHFKRSYCNASDSNGALASMCEHSDGIGAVDPKRMNKDIDFTKTLGDTLTLDLAYGRADKPTEDQEDIYALARNLYWQAPLDTNIAADKNEIGTQFDDVRQFRALSSLAHQSYTHLVGLKAGASADAASHSSGQYIKALLKNFGLPDAEIHARLGDNPSYYAQMEMLAKAIYQSPVFYTNLYDKPANIDRIGASLEAISLMQMRDFYGSKLRQEALLSGMITTAID